MAVGWDTPTFSIFIYKSCFCSENQSLSPGLTGVIGATLLGQADLWYMALSVDGLGLGK